MKIRTSILWAFLRRFWQLIHSHFWEIEAQTPSVKNYRFTSLVVVVVVVRIPGMFGLQQKINANKTCHTNSITQRARRGFDDVIIRVSIFFRTCNTRGLILQNAGAFKDTLCG